MLVASFGIVVSLVPMVSADPRESTVPIDNPNLTKACGLDVLMILDESGSINQRPRQRHRGCPPCIPCLRWSLANTGSSMSVIEFSTVARLPSIGGVPAGEYITIDDATEHDFKDYITTTTTRPTRPTGRTPSGWADILRLDQIPRSRIWSFSSRTATLPRSSTLRESPPWSIRPRFRWTRITMGPTRPRDRRAIVVPDRRFPTPTRSKRTAPTSWPSALGMPCRMTTPWIVSSTSPTMMCSAARASSILPLTTSIWKTTSMSWRRLYVMPPSSCVPLR